MKGFPNMGNLLKQAQKLQSKIEKMQAELEEKTVEASAGGGMVKVVVNGKQEIVSVHIDPEVIDPEDPEMLEDLIVAAVNEGLSKAKELVSEEMKKLTKGLNIPGLPSLNNLI